MCNPSSIHVKLCVMFSITGNRKDLQNTFSFKFRVLKCKKKVEIYLFLSTKFYFKKSYKNDSKFQHCLMLSLLTLWPWRWRQYVSPKHQYTSTRLHSMITQIHSNCCENVTSCTAYHVFRQLCGDYFVWCFSMWAHTDITSLVCTV
jgi:hypothetical protein